jgi:HSP20 family protein
VLHFDPFSDMESLTRDLLARRTGSDRSPRFMPMDSYKINDHYVLTADLPGIDPGSLRHHRPRHPDGDRQPVGPDPRTRPKGWPTSGSSAPSVDRVSLGENVDASRISASYDNGVLTVIIPVAETAKPRRIEVARGGGTRSIEPTTVDAQ